MKKLLATFIIFFGLLAATLPARADVMPYYINNISTNSIGVYQANKEVKIYKEANENSELLLDVYWDSKAYNCAEVSVSNLFIVFKQSKELAYLQVVDETEDWVEVTFNKGGYQKGWVKKTDPFRFLNWRVFFNQYGRKYGVYYLKDAPEMSKSLYGSNVEQGQKIGVINMPQMIKMTTVKGNWLLIQVYDLDRIQKIGWIKWRNTNGEIYLFPNIK